MGAKDDRGVIRFGFEVNRMIGCGRQRNLQFGLIAFDFKQPWDQPAHRARWYFQTHYRLLSACLLGHGKQMFECSL
ncbi:hypothetical protein D3C76_1138530 [compost metagenome]